MGARFKTKKYTLTGAPISLGEIFNTLPETFLSSITMRAGSRNVGLIVWRDASTGEDGGYLEPREAASFDLTNKYLRSSDVFVSGEADDIVYLSIIS